MQHPSLEILDYGDRDESLASCGFLGLWCEQRFEAKSLRPLRASGFRCRPEDAAAAHLGGESALAGRIKSHHGLPETLKAGRF